MGSVLDVWKLTKVFGGLAAVNDLEFHVGEREILGLIGPNGAGKSTVFNLINGFLPVTRGRITFEERDITGLKAHRIARLGIGRAFQASTLFMKLSVFENVFNGFHLRYRKAAWRSFLHTRGAKEEEVMAREEVNKILRSSGWQLGGVLAQNLPTAARCSACVAMAIRPAPALDEPRGHHPEEAAAMSDHAE
jgi:ABC-type branched-subunit amino acid transport system ATPase component